VGALSVRPGVARPETVLIAELLSGSLYVQGWPDGPAALLIGEDAAALRAVLDRAFAGSADVEAMQPPPT
jgi:hypothetical protein